MPNVAIGKGFKVATFSKIVCTTSWDCALKHCLSPAITLKVDSHVPLDEKKSTIYLGSVSSTPNEDYKFHPALRRELGQVGFRDLHFSLV